MSSYECKVFRCQSSRSTATVAVGVTVVVVVVVVLPGVDVGGHFCQRPQAAPLQLVLQRPRDRRLRNHHRHNGGGAAVAARRILQSTGGLRRERSTAAAAESAKSEYSAASKQRLNENPRRDASARLQPNDTNKGGVDMTARPSPHLVCLPLSHPPWTMRR